MNIVSSLYKLARFANDVSTVGSLSPKKIVRHFVVNKFIGKHVASRLFWKGGRGVRK